MRVGILGSGSMGGKLGTIFARAGHEVVFSYARSNDELKKLARDAPGHARAGTPVEAAKEADALLLAVHWSRIDEVLKQVGDLPRKVIVTCCLPMDSANSELVIGTTTSGGQELARKVPSAKVVCAFNTVPSEVLFGVFEARSKKPRPNLTRVLMRSMLDPTDRPVPRAVCAARRENRLQQARWPGNRAPPRAIWEIEELNMKKLLSLGVLCLFCRYDRNDVIRWPGSRRKRGHSGPVCRSMAADMARRAGRRRESSQG